MIKNSVFIRYVVLKLLRIVLYYATTLILLFFTALIIYFFIDNGLSTLLILKDIMKFSLSYLPIIFIIVLFIKEIAQYMSNKAIYFEQVLSFSNIDAKDSFKNIFFLKKLSGSELGSSAVIQKTKKLLNNQLESKASFKFLKAVAFAWLMSSSLLALLSFYLGQTEVLQFASRVISINEYDKLELNLTQASVNREDEVVIQIEGNIPDLYGNTILLEYGNEIKSFDKNSFLFKQLVLGKRDLNLNSFKLNFSSGKSEVLYFDIKNFNIQGFKYVIKYPSYIGKVDTLSSINGESFVKGSLMSIELFGLNVELSNIIFNNLNSNEANLILDKEGINDLELEIQNPYFKSNIESFFYVVEDNPAVISLGLLQSKDSIAVQVSTTDDFGLSEMEVFVNGNKIEDFKIKSESKKLDKIISLPKNSLMEELMIKVKDQAGNTTEEVIDLKKPENTKEGNKEEIREKGEESGKIENSELNKLKKELQKEDLAKDKLQDLLELYNLSKNNANEDELINELDKLKKDIKNDSEILKSLKEITNSLKDKRDKQLSGDKEGEKSAEEKLKKELERLQSRMSKYRKKKEENGEGASGSIDLNAEQPNIELILLMANTLSHKAERDENLLLASKMLYLAFKDSVSNFAKRNQHIGESMLESTIELDRKFNKLPSTNQGIYFDINNISNLFYEILKNKSDKDSKEKDKKNEDESKGDGSCDNPGGNKPKKSDLLGDQPNGKQPGQGGEGEQGEESDSNKDGKDGNGNQSTNQNENGQESIESQLEELLKKALSQQGKQALSSEELEEKRKLLKSIKGRESQSLKKELLTKLQISDRGIKKEEEYEQRKADAQKDNKEVIENIDMYQFEGVKRRNSLLKRNPLLLK